MSNEKEITRRLFEKQCSYEKDVKSFETNFEDIQFSTTELRKQMTWTYSEIARAYAHAIRIVNSVVSESNRAEVPGEG